MHFNLVGINHRTAPLTILEKVAIREGKLETALSALRSYIPSAVILSTCHRTEIYSTETGAEPASSAFFDAYLNIPADVLSRHIYVSEDRAAIEHLFHIAAGLDSMVVGEFEILGQVGHALEAAEKAGTVNLSLRQLFQSAVRAGRRVREETGISRNALSVSSVAVELATNVVGCLEGSKMLVFGAGEAGRLVAKAARDRGVSRVFVTSRTQDRASALAADLGGTSFSLDNLIEELSTANIVVACADAPHFILAGEQVVAAMRNRPELPLAIIDIAVPRNVDPAVAEIDNVFLYNIDDLNQISEQNRKQRETEINEAERIVADETAKFIAWWQTLESRPVISALMSKAEAIRQTHLDKTIKKLRPLSDEEHENLEAMTRAIVTKILQDPIERLKTNANGYGDYAAIVSELFQLHEDRQE